LELFFIKSCDQSKKQHLNGHWPSTPRCTLTPKLVSDATISAVQTNLRNSRFQPPELSKMVNSTLHPVWQKVLGITPDETPSAITNSNAAANYLMAQACAPMATTVAAPMAATIAAPTTHINQDWLINSANPVAGRPVGIKRQVGPNLFISTTVHPGDPRYPRFSTQHNPSPINL